MKTITVMSLHPIALVATKARWIDYEGEGELIPNRILNPRFRYEIEETEEYHELKSKGLIWPDDEPLPV